MECGTQKIGIRVHYFQKQVIDRETAEGWPPADCWNCGEWGLKEYKWKGSFLGWFVGLVVTVQHILSWLVYSGHPSTKYLFPHRTLFQFMCPHHLGTWAGSRAGPPVSECVSPVIDTQRSTHQTNQSRVYMIIVYLTSTSVSKNATNRHESANHRKYSKLKNRRDKNMCREEPRTRRQLIGRVVEANVPGRAVHRPADTYKRSGAMSIHTKVGSFKGRSPKRQTDM
jgi:hypothetical protein